jgi:hypothetical protein
MKKYPEKKEEMIKVMQLRPAKLKDNPIARARVVINLKEQFGFVPALMFIDKVYGKHDTIVISAVLPKEMDENENTAS